MSDLREHVPDQPDADPAAVDARGRLDVDRIKEQTALGDSKALDPRVRVYDPLEHISPAEEHRPVDDGGGRDHPDLAGLRDKVRSESEDRFEPSDAEQLVGKLEPKVGGVAGDEPSSTPRVADSAVTAVEAPAEDDFGPVDADLYRGVPCADQRPQRVYELDSCEIPLNEDEVDDLTEAKAKVAEVLGDASEELDADDVQEALQYVNPTGGRRNCVECAKAVDDILRGHAAVAGPTDRQAGYYVEAALAPRTLDRAEVVSSDEIERLLQDEGPGSRAIVVGWAGGYAAHAYNVANIGGELFWIDGQSDLMTEHNPHEFKSLDMYRTG